MLINDKLINNPFAVFIRGYCWSLFTSSVVDKNVDVIMFIVGMADGVMSDDGDSLELQ